MAPSSGRRSSASSATLAHGRRSSASSITLTPYTDLFKLCQQGNIKKHGGVSSLVDRTIGRVVWQLAGPSPASAGLALPRRSDGGLAAPGRFLYLLLRLVPGAPYAVHADLATADGALHRLSISNQRGARGEARLQRTGVQAYLEAEDETWTLVGADLAALAGRCSAAPFSHLRGLAFCASMTVRGAFCSDLIYGWDTLPGDLAFACTFDGGAARTAWVPAPPGEGARRAATPASKPSAPLPPVPRAAAAPLRRARQALAPADGGGQEAEPGVVATMQPNPLLQLACVVGFSGRNQQALAWAPGSDEVVFATGCAVVAMRAAGGEQRLLGGHARPVAALALSADGAVLASAEEGPQGLVRLWAFRQGQPLGMVAAGAGGVICLALSADGAALLTAGVTASGRQRLVWWDVAACRTGGQPREVASHESSHSILAASFVPLRPDRVVTCGKNSVRVYMLRDGQLRGLSVSMAGVQAARRPYSCGTLASATSVGVGEAFTCLAFEHAPGQLRPARAGRAHVGTASGALYVIDLDARAVEGVVQLHDGAIHAVAVHAGFCATAAGDRMLRLWGGDLRELYMEALHEGPVTGARARRVLGCSCAGLGVSPDGLHVVAGTECGTLGLLDVAGQSYVTLLRAHTGPVHAVAAAGSTGRLFCTASADGTARVWDDATLQQQLEFYAPEEEVLCVACSSVRTEVACGFASGAVRVFDAGSASLVQESRQHSCAVRQLAFAQGGHLLFSLGADGVVCCHEADRKFSPGKMLCTGFPLHAVAMAASPDGRTLAVATTCQPLGEQGIALFSTAALEPLAHLPVAPGTAITHMQLLPGARHVAVATADGRLQAYSCRTGSLVADVPRAHKGGCQAMAADPSGTFLVTAGSGGRLHVWGLHTLHQLPGGSSIAPAGAEAWRAEEPLPAQDGHGAAAAAAHPPTATAPVLRTLPCQVVAGHPGEVRDLAFVSQGQLVSVGDCMCSWQFSGQRCNHESEEPANLTASTTVVAMQPASVCEQRAGTAVRKEQRLMIISTAGADGSSAAQRSVDRVSAEAAGRCVPAYQAAAQFRLQPPQASLRHVVGFAAGVGFAWQPASGGVAYAAGNILLSSELGPGRAQRRLAQVPRPITAMAASCDGKLLASAVAPALGQGGADILLHVADEAGGVACRVALQFHSFPVQALEFSPDGAWLASLGAAVEPSLALWDAGSGTLVAAVALEAPVAGLAWVAGAALPTLYTASQGGLTQWQLEPEELCRVKVRLGRPLADVELTALACPAADPGSPHCQGAAPAATLVAGDSTGRVLELVIDADQALRSYSVLAELQGQAVSAVAATPGGRLVAAGTAAGTLLSMERCSDGWRMTSCQQLDGRVLQVQLDADAAAAVAATATGTLWAAQCRGRTPQPQVLLCGQQHAVADWQFAPGVDWSKSPPLLALASAAGVSVWQVDGDGSGGTATSPLVEFTAPTDALRVGIAPDGLACAAAYADGSVCLFDLAAMRLRWKAPAPRPGGVAGVAVLQRLRGTWVLVAYGDGRLVALEGASGRVGHRVSPGGTRGSGGSSAAEVCACTLAVSPADASLFALAGQEQVLVCKMHWAKSAAAQALGCLSLGAGPCGGQPPAGAPAVAFSTQHPGHVWATSPHRPGQLLLFDSATGAVVKTSLAPTADQPLTAIAVHPREELLAVGTAGGAVLLLRADTEAWAEVAGHGEPVRSLTFARGEGGERLLSAAGGATFVWELSIEGGGKG
eukprot:scaffold3.g6316.t1